MYSNNKVIKHLINQLTDLHNGNLWLGESFEKKINSIDEQDAFTKPLHYVHSIAEIIAHLTAWNKDLIKKLKNGIGELKEEDQHNWPTNEKLQKSGWEAIWWAYKTNYENVIELLRTKKDDFLDELYFDQDFKSEQRYLFALDGMLHHNTYHLGQLGLIIRILNEK